jgi:phage/plasmid-associated DNA primase
MYIASGLDHLRKDPKFFIWLGEGSNGKSFLLKMIEKSLQMFDNYGYNTTLNPAFLTTDRKLSGGPDTELISLKYARHVLFSESKENDELRTNMIKWITGETISANEKHQKQESFEAYCRYIFGSNYDPKISGSDYGTWRRILVYNFKMSFKADPNPNDDREVEINETYLNEWPNDQNYVNAFFSILVNWYRILQEEYGGKLDRVPKSTIDAETKAYQSANDNLSQFVYQTYEYDPTSEEEYDITIIANEYINWYSVNIGNINKMEPLSVKKKLYKLLKKNFEMRGDRMFLTKHRDKNVIKKEEETNDDPLDF